MRFLIDENLSSPPLASRLRASGHDPILVGDVGLLSATDARVLTYAIAQALPVLTQDYDDFEDLHDLIIAAAGHPSCWNLGRCGFWKILRCEYQRNRNGLPVAIGQETTLTAAVL